MSKTPLHPARQAIVDAWPKDVVADLKFADGLDDAIMGVAHVWDSQGGPRHVVLYDYAKCREILAEGGADEDEVTEHLEYNVLGSYVGQHTPAYAYLLETP